MSQLILHLIGDYVTQSHWMAVNKTKSTWAAFVHATVYSLPFVVLLRPRARALFTIWITHLLIDRFRLARYVVFAKNLLLGPDIWEAVNAIDVDSYTGMTWKDCNATGFPSDTPPWLAVWLLIVVDNTMHLAINYASLRWL